MHRSSDAPEPMQASPETPETRISPVRLPPEDAPGDDAGARGLRFLAEAGRILSSSLDYQTTLRTVARLATPTIADYSIVDLVEEDGSIHRVATAHRDPALESLAARLRDFPPDPLVTGGVPKVLFTGEPLMVRDVDDDTLRAATSGPDHLELARELGPRSFLIVPLNARSRTLGAITLSYTDSGRRYGRDELTLAEELAARAALAIDNARLHRDAQAELAERKKARLELDRQHAFLQLLLEIATTANEPSSFRETLRRALGRIRAHTRWPVGHAWIATEDRRLEPTDLWSTDDPERFEALREITLRSPLPIGVGLPGRVLATGQAMGVDDMAADPSYLDARIASELGVQAAFAFPVLIGTEVVAVLEFFSGRAIEPDLDFLDVMAHVGMQLGRVAERERAEHAVREGETRFREIAENIREVFWVTEPRMTRVLYVSPAYEEIWGRSREPLYTDPRAWMDAIVPEDRARVAAAEPLRIQGRYEIEYRVRRADGEVRWIHDRGFPVRGADGEVLRIVGIAEDITDDKRVEEERARLFALEQEAREKAEDAVHTRDEVLRMVAHDLQNPIHTVKLAASLLESQSAREEQRAQQISVIGRAADHMHRLVSGLLDLKRIEAGHGIPIERTPVDPATLLAQGHSLFEGQAEAKSIEIVREMPDDVEPVQADAGRLLQVLWNLTGNAIKFTPVNGRVTMKLAERPGEIVFSVVDTGPGIPEEARPRLFDPFWQDKRTARLGTGLGLPISKAIVEAHGGRIWVETAPGEGTTFFFSIPRN